ncbi:hypothetical protein B566_EDAN000547 [Ephemera danica]|nr:hypothetical protein B566_EDAN000547 [Ephemera danica]
MFDHHNRRIWHIDTDFDHGRSHEQLDLPGLEVGHHRFLLRRFHASVQQTDFELGKLAVLQLLSPLNCRLQIRPSSLGIPEQERPHRPAPGRQHVDDRDIQIAIDRHRQCPRDRRRREDQHIRLVAFVDQIFPLHHTELVLFIHNRESEILEGHALLDQRMGANRHLHLTGSQLRRLGFFHRHLVASTQQHDTQPQRLQRTFQIAIMLLGQNFSRRHERSLVTGAASHDNGMEPHHRLPRPDIALHQPVHRLGRDHVPINFANDLILRGCQTERQQAAQRIDDRRPRIELEPLRLLLH